MGNNMLLPRKRTLRPVSRMYRVTSGGYWMGMSAESCGITGQSIGVLKDLSWLNRGRLLGLLVLLGPLVDSRGNRGLDWLRRVRMFGLGPLQNCNRLMVPRFLMRVLFVS